MPILNLSENFSVELFRARPWIYEPANNRILIGAANDVEGNSCGGVAELIEGVSYHWRHEAHRILRHTIVVHEPIRVLARSATRLCAKRLFFASEHCNAFDHHPAFPFGKASGQMLKLHEVPRAQAPQLLFEEVLVSCLYGDLDQASPLLRKLARSRHSPAAAAKLLVAATERLRGGFLTRQTQSHGRVGALLMTAAGQTLAVSFNLPELCQMWHAEWLLLKNPPTERDLILISTRKPCRMCAALIFGFLEKGTIQKVYYVNFDAGPHAHSTILNASSCDRLFFAPHRAGEWEEQLKIFSSGPSN